MMFLLHGYDSNLSRIGQPREGDSKNIDPFVVGKS